MRVTAEIEIEGIKPFLMNSFPTDTFATHKSKKGSQANNHEEWKAGALMDKDRRLYIFPSYIVGSIKEGGKYIKIGKATLAKKVGSCLECCYDFVYFDDLIVPLEKDITRLTTEPIYLDVRPVVNPATRGRMLRYRIAAKAGWKIKTRIVWDDFVISKDDMQSCVQNAGLFEGIGDGRRIGFGKYKLLSFKMRD